MGRPFSVLANALFFGPVWPPAALSVQFKVQLVAGNDVIPGALEGLPAHAHTRGLLEVTDCTSPECGGWVGGWELPGGALLSVVPRFEATSHWEAC